MTERGIRERVKELCEKMVLVEPTDLKGLGDLYRQMSGEGIRTGSGGSSRGSGEAPQRYDS
jgi:hypothetical protein